MQIEVEYCKINKKIAKENAGVGEASCPLIAFS